ncbi:MAG: hypothetical protein P8R42_22290 [Candidatus Binatia bacterium]|nr:hypothetical protein [Candidatus Binatia bacterium]
MPPLEYLVQQSDDIGTEAGRRGCRCREHEVAERCGLVSISRGREPHRSVVFLPAPVGAASGRSTRMDASGFVD